MGIPPRIRVASSEKLSTAREKRMSTLKIPISQKGYPLIVDVNNLTGTLSEFETIIGGHEVSPDDYLKAWDDAPVNWAIARRTRGNRLTVDTYTGIMDAFLPPAGTELFFGVLEYVKDNSTGFSEEWLAGLKELWTEKERHILKTRADIANITGKTGPHVE